MTRTPWVACGVAGAMLAQETDVPVLRPPSDASGPRTHFTSGWGPRDRLAEQGVTLEAAYTADWRGVVSGGLGRGGNVEGLGEVGVRLEPEKWGGWKGFNVYAWGLFPHGQSLSQRRVGDFQLVSDLDAFRAPRLYELWLEQTAWDNHVSLRLGQLSVEEDFGRSDLADTLQHASFGWAPFTGQNLPSTGYPYAAPGARLKLALESGSWISFGAFDGDPDPLDTDGNPTNPNGLRVNLSEGVLAFTEVGVRLGRRLPAVIRAGVWYHSHRFKDRRFDDMGQSLALGGAPRVHFGNWGGYVMGDHRLWREAPESDQGLEVFWRFAWEPGDRNQVDFYAEAGWRYTGPIPGRDDDAIAFGFAFADVSESDRRAVADANRINGTSLALPDHEAAFEVMYDYVVRPWWHVQPDVQYIAHPGGSTAVRDAVVIGLRTTFAF
jgi:porin